MPRNHMPSSDQHDNVDRNWMTIAMGKWHVINEAPLLQMHYKLSQL
jgi:hypothetical protein